ncbi:MAG: metallophosphoesterase [Leptolyngbya sp. SIO1E4]|nr:metallophosphoesterase [Leptolyngbya sp. SIO1E4]
MHAILSGPLTVERVTVSIRDLPLSLHGTTLIQLSDFHFDGLRLSPELLQQAIAHCNAIFPDLVILTGDFVTKETQPIYRLAACLKGLKSRHGTYAVLGNHDDITRSGRRTIINALRQANISVLWNDIAYPLGEALPLVGLADLWSGECQPEPIFSQLSSSIPRLVLAHNPDTAEMLQPWRADLQLSGHTHGGQILVPGVGSLPYRVSQIRPFLPRWVKKNVPYLKEECDRVIKHWEWALGLHQIGQNQLYVNRGLGTYLPGRFFCPPELTVLTLVTANPI